MHPIRVGYRVDEIACCTCACLIVFMSRAREEGVYAVIHGCGTLEALHELNVGSKIQNHRVTNVAAPQHVQDALVRRGFGVALNPLRPEARARYMEVAVDA